MSALKNLAPVTPPTARILPKDSKLIITSTLLSVCMAGKTFLSARYGKAPA
jgi:hypothetical protein